jgi:hypothetical protein
MMCRGSQLDIKNSGQLWSTPTPRYPRVITRRDLSKIDWGIQLKIDNNERPVTTDTQLIAELERETASRRGRMK